MKCILASLIASAHGAGKWISPCNDVDNSFLPFCNQSLSVEDRAKDLVGRISKDDKLGVNTKTTPLSNSGSAMPSMKITDYEWWSEALHGVANSPGVTFDDDYSAATSFPQVISTSMSFNTTLFREVGSAIGREARATYQGSHAGLTFWTPNVNNARDPRWGRLQETPGEDPFVTSTYVKSYVPALQHDKTVDPEGDFLQISACCKHYAAYSLENYGGIDRFHFDSNITDQDFADVYFPPFEACASKDQAAASSIMCSYNAVNGVPSCASKWLMTDKARGEWAFDGYITSDCGATDDVISAHHYFDTTSETVKGTLEAGMDSDCGGFMESHLAESVENGTVSMDLVDTALTNLLKVQFRLGMFDNDDKPNPYASISKDAIDTAGHRQLALEAARQSVTLLKNENSALPFSPDTKKILLVGPHAKATSAMQANYYGTAPYLISPEEGFGKFAETVVSDGCSIGGMVDPDGDAKEIAEAVKQVADTSFDEIVLAVGIDQTVEAEGLDRTSIGLTGSQGDLIEQVAAAAASNGKAVHLVVLSGGAVCLGLYKDDDRIGSITYIGYPGQSGGQALAEAMFGDYNPSGRLTQTFFNGAFVDESDFLSMHFRPNVNAVGEPGRTYRFYTGDNVVFPFGHGLSYTSFDYEKVALNDKLLELSVTNSGGVVGAETILVYLKPPADSGLAGLPLKSLRGFQKFEFGVGDVKQVMVQFNDDDFKLAMESGEVETVSGSWTILVGGMEIEIEIE